MPNALIKYSNLSPMAAVAFISTVQVEWKYGHKITVETGREATVE